MLLFGANPANPAKKRHNHRMGEVCELCVQKRLLKKGLKQGHGIKQDPGMPGVAPDLVNKGKLKPVKSTQEAIRDIYTENQSVLSPSQSANKSQRGTVWSRKGLVRSHSEESDCDEEAIRRSD